MRKVAALVLGLATAAALVFNTPAARACDTPAPATVTYAFYTTDTGVPASSALAPAGWAFNDNTDFEDDHPGLCDVTLLAPHTDAYVCTVPLALAPDDTTYDVHFTDDGELTYADGTVLTSLG